MESPQVICPQCHATMRAEYYFCYNCGKNLHPAPLSTSVLTQTGIYVGSVILAPMGLIWGLRYLRQSSGKAKMIGLVSVILTVVTLIIMSKLITVYIARVNEQVTKQMNGLQGF